MQDKEQIHTSMTEFDKILIEKADTISRYDYRDINVLMNIADTDECRRQLALIKRELYESVLETL